MLTQHRPAWPSHGEWFARLGITKNGQLLHRFSWKRWKRLERTWLARGGHLRENWGRGEEKEYESRASASTFESPMAEVYLTAMGSIKQRRGKKDASQKPADALTNAVVSLAGRSCRIPGSWRCDFRGCRANNYAINRWHFRRIEAANHIMRPFLHANDCRAVL